MEQGSSGPALWSAEEPNLYILVLSLIAPDGSHVESESCQVRKLQSLPLLSFCMAQMALEQVQVKCFVTKLGCAATTVSLSGVMMFMCSTVCNLVCTICSTTYCISPHTSRYK